jgi:Ner family transcriptional regulator
MAKKPAPQDWHRADIVAAFRKRNTTLARYSRQCGYTSTWLAQATGRAYPRAERVIA